MQTDYIIIGQGICGTLLSHCLLAQQQRIVVIDDASPHASSRVASGLINPVTGKRVVQSWMINEFMRSAEKTYTEIDEILNTGILQTTSLLSFHTSPDEKAIFHSRTHDDDNQYLHPYPEDLQKDNFHFRHGVDEIAPCWLVDLPTLLQKWRNHLTQENALLSEQFNPQHLQLQKDHITYRHITARAIIFCGGISDFTLPFFSALPWSPNKGEVLIASIPGLPRTHIYKHGIKIVPFKDDLFWIGASFQWKYDDLAPTPAFRAGVEQQLNSWLRLPYTIVDHWAAQRPSTLDYKPFLGHHPLHPAVFMLNGMGTKGCSQAPYFAAQLTQHLLHGTPILPQASLHRYQRILTK